MINKTICVTGDQGFIGNALKNELIRMGYQVKGLEKWIFDRTRWQDRLIEYLVDMQPDVVFHVGACSDTLETDATTMLKLNTESTMVMADWCQFKGIPFIFSSSAAVYGDGKEPSNLYGWSKYLAEQYVIKCGGIALRYFNVYGYGEMHKGRMASMVYQMYQNKKWGKEIKLFPNHPKRDFVYVKDVVSANIFAMKFYEQFRGMHHDVGTCESRTFEDICKCLDVPYTYTEADAVPKGYQMFTQADRRRTMMGWNAEYNLEDGIKDYLHLLQMSELHI